MARALQEKDIGGKNMSSQKLIINLKKILALSIFVLFASSPLLANGGDAARAISIAKDESIAIASKSLSKKLQADLVLKTVSVKFNKAEQYYISNSLIGLKGEGTCRIDGEATDLPINFDVKIDVGKHNAADVRYVFLNSGADSTVEDAVTEKLLQKMKSDFKTEDIVIAVDYVKEATLEDGEEGFSGSGEVKLNGMIWRKVEFNAKAGNEKSDVSILKYQIK